MQKKKSQSITKFKMKSTAVFKFLIAALCGLSYAPAFAFYVNVVESKTSSGAQGPLYSQSGPATTSSKSSAGPLSGWTGGGLTGVGSWFAGETTPSKTGDWSFTPDATHGGYYNVYATWFLPTAAQTPAAPPTWTVHNAGADVNISLAQNSGANGWNLLGSGLKYNASTTYTTRLGTSISAETGKRTFFDSVAWAAATPTAVVNTAPPNGATGIPTTGPGNDLSWTAGANNSFFDVFLDINPTPTTLVSGNQTGTTFDPDSVPLLDGTTYYWSVTAKNVDRTAAGTVWSFTTAEVPEPSAMALSLLGGFGLAVGAIARRRKA